jgi:hypothetical protein
MTTWKQRRNIGRLTWLILFAIGAVSIWFLIENHWLAGLSIAIWGSFVYLIVPPILKSLGIWR